MALYRCLSSKVVSAKSSNLSYVGLLNPETLVGLDPSIFVPQYCFKNHTGLPVLAVDTLVITKDLKKE